MGPIRTPYSLGVRTQKLILDIVMLRSEIMRRVPRADSKPEMAVRRILHRAGFRYRLHIRQLPGTPDIVMKNLNVCIFVHGCFWHRHGCHRTTTPKTNSKFWLDKFKANVARDERVRNKLSALGWKVIILWECQTDDMTRLRNSLIRRLIRRKTAISKSYS